MTGRDDLRIGDAERTEAANELGEHYAQGRLTTEEHHERLDQVWAARTRADLAPVFRDLPGSTYAAVTRASYPSARLPGLGADRRGQGMRRWTGGIPPVVPVVLAVLAVVFVATHLPVILVGLLVWFVLFHKIGRHHRHPAMQRRRRW